MVDVHGSAQHRAAIAAALAASHVRRATFRWLHEPLKEWVWDAGDAHAGGAETAMIEHIRSDLVDPAWWPARSADLQRHQMPQAEAMELAKDLPRFIAVAESSSWNGIVGKIEICDRNRAGEMMSLAISTAVEDVRQLLER